MEEQLVAARAHLRHLLYDHPDWPYQEYADQIGRPRDWVKRWVKRLREAPATDETVLWNRSSARHHLPPPLHPTVIDRILDIRDHPPEHLQRTPGPKAILYYLHRDQELLAQGLRLPRSTRTSLSDAHRAWPHRPPPSPGACAHGAARPVAKLADRPEGCGECATGPRRQAATRRRNV
jgi:hypothetical protein